jgi:hypothetical protein
MFIQIEDPSDLPRPPEEVQVRAVAVEPYPDGRRLRVIVELTPFQEPPDLSLRILDQERREVADLSIISAHQATLGFTVHLRGPAPKGRYTMETLVTYEQLGQVHQLQHMIELPMEVRDDTA